MRLLVRDYHELYTYCQPGVSLMPVCVPQDGEPLTVQARRSPDPRKRRITRRDSLY